MCLFLSSRRRHTRLQGDWSSDVCSSDLHEPAPSSRDLRKRALEGSSCHPMPPMPLVDEDAGDPPARSWRWFLLISARVLEQELIAFPVLTPALRDTRLVEHQCRMGTALVHQLLLQGTRIADAALVLRMVHHAPA